MPATVTLEMCRRLGTTYDNLIPVPCFKEDKQVFFLSSCSKLSKTDVRICKTSSVNWDESQ